MIKDTITYGNEIILTIYHKGFDAMICKRSVTKKQKMGSFNLVFREDTVTTLEGLLLPDTDKHEGLLGEDDGRNPYRGCCAFMSEYFSMKKPKSIFKQDNNKYSLKILTKTFSDILNFIAQYTGIDLFSNPMCLGNTFIFECKQRNLNNHNHDIFLDISDEDDFVCVSFKKDNIVVDSIVHEIDHPCEQIPIKSYNDWDNIDLQVYSKNKLVFFRNSISQIKTIITNTYIMGNPTKIKPDKEIGDITIPGKETIFDKQILGAEPNQYQVTVHNSNIELTEKLALHNKKDTLTRFVCLTDGIKSESDMDHVRELIIEVITNKCDELWIFDPYFAHNKFKGTKEWLNIIAQSYATKKCVVYFKHQKNENLQNFSLDLVPEENRKLGILLYETELYVHDRFIFSKYKEKIECLCLGTSLNSLIKNAYCIHRLDPKNSEEIFSKLQQSVVREINKISI